VVAYLFAGQGSQYVGMGKDLYQAFAQSKAVFDKAEEVLDFPLTRLIFEGPEEELTRTVNCQPAILTMTIAAWEAFRSVNQPQACIGSYTAGLSLGEYSALVAAEAISFEDAVHLVRRRGELMEEEAAKRPGKMASILGLDLAAVRDICRKANAEIANINCPGQVVISGGIKEIAQASRLAEEQGAKKVILLEVSGAFHSSFMAGASLRFAEELRKIKINTAGIPVVSNVSARPVSQPEEIIENLVKQITATVLWEDSMKFIISKGIMNFMEFGPGKVLKGLMRRIDSNAQVRNIEKKEDVVNFTPPR
jgi:[acyl-carrier-protein] S-malonyltransferase